MTFVRTVLVMCILMTGSMFAGGSTLLAADCNGNGIEDADDILGGTSADCNTNGIPDECEIEVTLSEASGPLIPLGTSTPQSFTIVSAPVAIGDVVLSFQAVGNLNAVNENVTVDINGTVVGVILTADTVFLCQDPPSTDQLVVPAATYNAAVNGGDAIINMVASIDVEDGGCNNQAFISVSVDYPLVAGLPDCNGNGTLDECELTSGTAQDCDTNGVPDDCQTDTDGDGVIDACDACPYLCGDMNGSGTAVDLLDFAKFSLCFGLIAPDAQCDTTSFACANLNADESVNLLDFATFSLTFGGFSINSPPNCP